MGPRDDYKYIILIGLEPDLAGTSPRTHKSKEHFHCDFYLAQPLGHIKFWFFFAKQDALSPRAYFTVFLEGY